MALGLSFILSIQEGEQDTAYRMRLSDRKTIALCLYHQQGTKVCRCLRVRQTFAVAVGGYAGKETANVDERRILFNTMKKILCKMTEENLHHRDEFLACCLCKMR